MQYSHRKKKKTEWDMGEYMPTNEQISARLWCIKNGIKISPFARQPGSWYIDITVNGKTNRSPHIYIKDLIWEKIYEYYKYYYDKYKK
jgi:hypothetical protein